MNNFSASVMRKQYGYWANEQAPGPNKRVESQS